MTLEISKTKLASKLVDYLTFGDSIIVCNEDTIDIAKKLFPTFKNRCKIGFYNGDVFFQKDSEDILSTQETYTTLLGFKRIGNKIGDGYWYLDSELKKPVMSNKLQVKLTREDFEQDNLQNFYKDSEGNYHIGFKHRLNSNLILLQETKEVYDLKECKVLTKL